MRRKIPRDEHEMVIQSRRRQTRFTPTDLFHKTETPSRGIGTKARRFGVRRITPGCNATQKSKATPLPTFGASGLGLVSFASSSFMPYWSSSRVGAVPIGGGSSSQKQPKPAQTPNAVAKASQNRRSMRRGITMEVRRSLNAVPRRSLVPIASCL